MAETIIGWIFVYSLFPGVIALTIFEKKGGNGFQGFLLGALLSYIGVVVVLFIPSKHQTLRDRRNKKIEERKKTIGMIRGTMRSCNNCGEIIENDVFVCKHCGKYG